MCDYQMGGMNGDVLTRRFREWEAINREKEQKIFALTAYASANVRKLCIEAGMQGIITKPLGSGVVKNLFANGLDLQGTDMGH